MLALVVLGLVFRLAVVPTPLFEDDLHQLAFLCDSGTSSFSFRNDLDLCRYLDGDQEAARAKMELGALPWRFDEKQRVAHFRPVASAVMWIDHMLFGVESLAFHLHSAVWFLLFLLLVRSIYRRILPVGLADLATLATLLSPVSIATVKWWSCRYALVTAALAAGGILFHLRWHRSGRQRDRMLSLGFLASSLLAGEIGIQGFAVIFAYTLVRAGGSVARVVRELWPCMVFLVAYMLSRPALGYGVEHGVLYIDPLLEPGEFLAHVWRNAQLLLVGAVLNQVTEGDVPQIATWQLISLVALLACVSAAALGGLVRRRDRPSLTLLLWLLLASLLSLAFCFTSRRELRPWTFMIAQIPTNALLALLVVHTWQRRPRLGDLRAWRVLAARTAAALLATVWLLVPLRAHWVAAKGTLDRQRRDSPAALRARFPDEVRQAISARTKAIVFVRSPDPMIPPSFLPLWYGIETAPDLITFTLSDTAKVACTTVLTRTGTDSLRLTSLRPLIRANDLYRFDERFPLQVGQTVSLANLTATVEDLVASQGPPGTPTLPRLRSAQFTFSISLDSEDTLILTWSENRFEKLALPPVGQSITLR